MRGEISNSSNNNKNNNNNNNKSIIHGCGSKRHKQASCRKEAPRGPDGGRRTAPFAVPPTGRP